MVWLWQPSMYWGMNMDAYKRKLRSNKPIPWSKATKYGRVNSNLTAQWAKNVALKFASKYSNQKPQMPTR